VANFIWKDFLQQTVSAVGSAGTGAFTVSSAVSGYQALGAGDDGNIGYFSAREGTKWQTFVGTYTHSGTSLARTLAIDGSAGAGVNETFTTAAVIFLDISSNPQQAAHNLTRGQIYGLNLLGLSAVSLGAAAGCAHIEASYNAPIATASLTALTGLTGTAAHFYHVYGYLSSGAWTLDTLVDGGVAGSSSAPVAFAVPAGSALSKPSDATRRYLGTILYGATNVIRPFLCRDLGAGLCEYIYTQDMAAAAPFAILNGGSATNYTALDMSALIPNTGAAVEALLSVCATVPSSGSFAQCYLSIDGIGFTSLVYNPATTPAGNQSSYSSWLPINANTTSALYYKVNQANVALYIYCWGYRFRR
jgi:hypothetical protein